MLSLFKRLAFRPRFPAYLLQTFGIEDEKIESFQKILNKRGGRYGISVPITGVYDVRTREAVKRFQQRSLSVTNSDGLVGPQTAKKLKIRLIGDP